MKQYISRKQSIVISALEIINELGIEGLSIRELAKRQGVVEGALYKHFKSKEEILQAILDYYTRYDSKIKNTIDNSKLTPRESIKFIIKSYAEIFESNPALICITRSFEIMVIDDPIVNRVKEIYTARLNYLTYLIEEGQKDGSIDTNILGEDLSSIIFGLFRTITLKWRISNDSFPLKPRVEGALESLLSRF